MIPAIYPLACLGVCLIVLAAILLRPRLKAFKRCWFLVAAILAVVWAGDKPPSWTFAFNLGLHDNGSTYDQTEGAVVARWTYDAPVTSYVFRWSYSVDGGEYIQLPDANVADGTASALIDAGPTNTVRIQCWPQYVRPIEVVTNGVYHMNGVMRSIDTTNSPLPKYVTPGIPIYADLSDGSREFVAPITNAPAIPSSSASLSVNNQDQGE